LKESRWLVELSAGRRIGALRTGENQVPLPRAQPPIFGERYSGERLVHIYEWMFAPWAVTLAAVVAAVALLLRTNPALRTPAGLRLATRSSRRTSWS
jgi:hypothetical protein